MKVISLINHKGGTGKTTSTINIGSILAGLGHKTLLIDLDAQSNLSQGLGIIDPEKSIYDSFSKLTDLEIINFSENLSVCPASLDLAGIEMEISSRIGRENILKRLLEKVQESYDYVLIDCPPSLGFLTVNALVASHTILIPMQAEYFAFKGINTIFNIIQQVRENYNKNLMIAGVFMTRVNDNRKMSKEYVEKVKEAIDTGLLESKIRINVSLPRSQELHLPITSHDPLSNGASDYTSLVNELIEKELI